MPRDGQRAHFDHVYALDRELCRMLRSIRQGMGASPKEDRLSLCRSLNKPVSFAIPGTCECSSSAMRRPLGATHPEMLRESLTCEAEKG